MKLYYCENNTKGNHYVVVQSMIQAVALFTTNTRVQPDKITTCDENLIMENNLVLVKDGE